MSKHLLGQTFDRIEAIPQRASNTLRDLTLRIGTSDWRAVMDSTHVASSNSRTPERWNSIPIPERVAQRAITNIDKQLDGCWISRYSVSTHGYAQVGWSDGGKNQMVLAHRAAWTAVNGQLPMGVTLDHICKVRQCVNPGHLRVLSNIENARRNQGDDFPMGQCRHGHPNTALVKHARRTKSGERRYGLTCGECLKDSRDRWSAANADKLREIHRAYRAKKRERRTDV